MSEESLRAVLDKIEADEGLRERLSTDPAAAVSELDLSPSEMVAILTNDEDGLRRLVGAETGAFAYGGAAMGGTMGGVAVASARGCSLHLTDVIGGPKCELVISVLGAGGAGAAMAR